MVSFDKYQVCFILPQSVKQAWLLLSLLELNQTAIMDQIEANSSDIYSHTKHTPYQFLPMQIQSNSAGFLTKMITLLFSDHIAILLCKFQSWLIATNLECKVYG